ncbi:MAG: hypothetical protein ACREIW_05060 [Chthoniobacterales bacterium]
MTPADVSVDLTLGTLGIGLQVGKLLTPHIGGRVAAHYFSLNKNTTQSDVEYAADIKLQSFSALVDFFPSARGAFHLTGGLLSNQSSVDAVGDCTNGDVKLNNRSYTCAQVGTLTGKLEFPSAAPYVGLGFGTPAKGSKFHFVFDLGGAFGTPTLTLNASNSGSNAQLASDVAAQRDKTQHDINKFTKVYPMIEFGLGVRF